MSLRRELPERTEWVIIGEGQGLGGKVMVSGVNRGRTWSLGISVFRVELGVERLKGVYKSCNRGALAVEIGNCVVLGRLGMAI